MPVTILLFGPLAAAAGARLMRVEGTTCGELRANLSQNPALAHVMKTARFAVNQSFVNDDQPVTSGDEVALIPPVSGGAW